jgi:hypothetical protein
MEQLDQPIMSQASENWKVHRLFRKEVHSSEWKRPAPLLNIMGDDIVSPIGEPVAARKGGVSLAS